MPGLIHFQFFTQSVHGRRTPNNGHRQKKNEEEVSFKMEELSCDSVNEKNLSL